ncbi:peroxidase 42-like [Salvia hispanica]|uniref:peroxidase 42-like n=1 Tax=Salvia hispanica TaxID=49212 RepID=UPI0020097F97|nr:peroxidase 42-like [Salvia hispanica]
MSSINRALFFFTVLYFISLFAFAESEAAEFSYGYQTSTCSYAEDIIREQLQLLHMRHNTTSFSWLRHIINECFVESSCDASLLLDSTRRVMAEKEADGSSEMRSFRYVENVIREALGGACPELRP